jgi:hypothetical protein
VNKPNVGTLPDFGNFFIDRQKGEQYDRYLGTTELMPFAKGVSAKSHDFDEAGNEKNTDYRRMLKIVKDAGYRGLSESSMRAAVWVNTKAFARRRYCWKRCAPNWREASNSVAVHSSA